ncbi:neutral zinc metallopeptidase [Kribbella sp. NPDC048915]|uniref:neutral zinc metallopeptidase n=1 Tax=Kribbella sp. NPDC048915 TaxID=3155148 RepID=UPI0033C1AE22
MNAQAGAVAAVSVVAVLAAAGVIAARQFRDADEVLVARTSTVRTATPTPTPTRAPRPTSSPTLTSPTRTTPTRTVDPTQKLLAEKLRIVAQNPLYRVGRLPASRCKEPSVRPTSVANVRKYYAQSIACLDKTWKPVIVKAGFTFQSPRLEVFTGKLRTSCDVQDSAAYCGNGVISMNATYDMDNYRKYDRLWTRTTMAHLIAHEYAHHIQRLVGISAASWTRTTYLNGVDATLQESRRVELQASCLSGAYLGADRSYFPVSGAWRTRYLWTIRNRGDEWGTKRDHGSAKNHSRWTRRGFDAGSASACNTFTASAGTVS